MISVENQTDRLFEVYELEVSSRLGLWFRVLSLGFGGGRAYDPERVPFRLGPLSLRFWS